MDLHGFDLNLLVALDALLAERSVTNAGRRVHLSQSAMSGVLARLRRAFNDDLLVPGRGGMTLTPLAEALVDPVNEILRRVEHTLSTYVRFDPASSRRLFTVAASDYAVTVLLTPALRELHRQAPSVSVTIVPLRDGMESLEDRQIDLMVLPRAYVPPSRTPEVLFDDVFTGIVASDHPAVGARLSAEQYRSLGHVIVSFAQDRRVSIDDFAIAEAGLDRRVDVVAPSFHALPGLVAGTERVATIQYRLATMLASVYPIRIVDLPIELPVLEEVLLWNPRFDRDPGHAWFRGVLKQAAAALPARTQRV
jgi:LysR family transcriptional regulator, nod-box dependent transcriptional activator